MKEKKSYYTSTEKKAMQEAKKRRRQVWIVILLILSLVLNVLQFMKVKIPFISNGISIPILDSLLVDNSEFETFIIKNEPAIVFTVVDNGEKIEYTLEDNGDKATLSVIKNDNFLEWYRCDFDIAKYEELKKIVLSKQLKWYNSSEHVDNQGKVLSDNSKYSLAFEVYHLVTYSLETPKNGAEIEKFFVELDAIAKDSPDKKQGGSDEASNTDFTGYFYGVSINDGTTTYKLMSNGDTCRFTYKGADGDCSCVFVSEKLDGLKELILFNELKWAEKSENVDSDGKVTYEAYESPYTVELYDYLQIIGKRIETPANIDQIISYMKELARIAKS